MEKGENQSSSGLDDAGGSGAVVHLVERCSREEKQRSDLEHDEHVLDRSRELGADDADRRHQDDVRDCEHHHRGLRRRRGLPADELVRVARTHVCERADDEDPGRDHRPATEPAEPRPERARHPRERRAGVLVGAVHVEEGACDQEHRDERGEHGSRRLETDDHGDRADHRCQRIGGRCRRQTDRQGLAEADRVRLEPGSGRLVAWELTWSAHSASFTTTCLTRVYSSIE